jgi:hypothetical protein
LNNFGKIKNNLIDGKVPHVLWYNKDHSKFRVVLCIIALRPSIKHFLLCPSGTKVKFSLKDKAS